MVFAKTRLAILEYLFEPDKDFSLNYSGPHPEKLYTFLFNIIKNVINIPETHIHESAYSWEVKGDAEKFNVRWRGVKDFDIYSYLRVDVVLKGYTQGGKGYASIKIKPRFITEYPQDNIFQQSILYEVIRRMWDTAFYSKKREAWKIESRAVIAEFTDRIKKFMSELRHS